MKRDEHEIPTVIPPGTVVRLGRCDRNTPEWKIDVGRQFRVGYYRPSDGLDCIWLVNDTGEYEQTTDRKSLLAYFEIVRLSDETDHFGETRRPLRGLTASVRRPPIGKIKGGQRAVATNPNEKSP